MWKCTFHCLFLGLTFFCIAVSVISSTCYGLIWFLLSSGLGKKKTFFHVFYFLALAGHLFFSCGLCYLCRLLFDTHTREYGVGRRKSEGNMEKVPVNRSWFVFSMRMRPCLVWELQISAAQSHCGTSSTVRDLLENFNLEYLYDGWRKKELIFSDEYSFKETVRIWATYLLQMFCFTCKKKRWEFSVTLHYITFSWSKLHNVII